MTLLIGATGCDGIALGADRKVMRGGEAHYASKINIIERVAFAAEGYTELAEDFLLLLNQEVTCKKVLERFTRRKRLRKISSLNWSSDTRSDSAIPLRSV